MAINLYQYNPKTMLMERIPLRQILILPLILFLGIIFNFLYFRAEIINDWEWSYKNDKLVKENNHITLEEWISQ